MNEISLKNRCATRSRLLPIILVCFLPSWAEAAEKVTVKLGGQKFSNRLALAVDSGSDVISKSQLYRFKASDKLRGRTGELKRAFPKVVSIKAFMNDLEPGASSVLQGFHENPSETLPVTLITKSLSGSRKIKGFGKVRIQYEILAEIDANGLISFELGNVAISNKNGKLKGTMAFRTGKLVVTTAPTFQFQTTNVSVDENSGSVSLTVLREGFAGRSASVTFATVDDSAKAGINYTPSTGVIVFGTNETAKAISIPLIDNVQKDKPLQFSIVLSEPSEGAVLGKNVNASVRLKNDDR